VNGEDDRRFSYEQLLLRWEGDGMLRLDLRGSLSEMAAHARRLIEELEGPRPEQDADHGTGSQVERDQPQATATSRRSLVRGLLEAAEGYEAAVARTESLACPATAAGLGELLSVMRGAIRIDGRAQIGARVVLLVPDALIDRCDGLEIGPWSGEVWVRFGQGLDDDKLGARMALPGQDEPLERTTFVAPSELAPERRAAYAALRTEGWEPTEAAEVAAQL
jgi:hypothetical protein